MRNSALRTLVLVVLAIASVRVYVELNPCLRYPADSYAYGVLCTDTRLVK